MKSKKQLPSAARWVVMGGNGCGERVVGALLAQALHARFIEGDAFHSPAKPANFARMAAGIPLEDEDRTGWLDILAAQTGAAAANGALRYNRAIASFPPLI